MRTSLITIKLEKPETKGDIEKSIITALFNYLPGEFSTQTLSLNTAKTQNGVSEEAMTLFIGESLTVSVRFYSKESMFAINIDASESCQDYCKKFNNSSLARLQKALEGAVRQEEIERIPVIKRNNQVPVYFTSSDNRVLEYDFDEVKFRKRTDFQNVKILHSPTFGNTLILDDLQNLAEADLPYTQGLMKFGINSYKDKEILILGGGDGGLLHELLKESPKHIYMVDIDFVVMAECQKHLKGACGSDLDTFNGPNYTVIVDDCFVHLKKFAESGHKFDYIFNDLTDIPINADDGNEQKEEEEWDFVRRILEFSKVLLKENSGRYLNHAIGVGCVKALKDYEQVLTDFGFGFVSHTVFVPSFMEEWVFYEAWQK